MVQFGILDEDDNQIAIETHKKFIGEPNVEESPDDTFEYRKAYKGMPGGFYEALGLPAEPDSTLSQWQSKRTEQVSQDTATVDSTDLTSGKDVDLASISGSEIIDDATDNLHSVPDSPRSQTSDISMQSHPEDWLVQLQQSGARFAFLHTAPRPLPSHRTQLAGQTNIKRVRKLSYNSQQLDADLFGLSATFKAQPSQSMTRSLFNKKMARPTFLFRWGSHGSLIISGQEETQKKSIAIRSISTGSGNTSSLLHCLAEQFKNTSIDLDTSGLPVAQTLASMKAASVMNDHMNQNDKSLWNLASALFDPVSMKNVEDKLDDAQELRSRKAAVSRWLEVAVAKSVKVDEARARDPAERIFAKLTGHQIAEACAIALSNGDFRLATLIPLAGGDQNMRNDIRHQYEDWAEKGVLPHIDLPYRIIYNIIGGSITECAQAPGNQASLLDKEYPTSLGLDWKRAFGLRFWYSCVNTDTIHHALTQYEGDIKASEVSVAQPVLSDERVGSEFDAHYLLLKLYSGHAHDSIGLLNSRAMNDAPLDYRNPWLLIAYLCKARSLDSITSAVAEYQAQTEQLTLRFASQLECAGHWQWAVFIALHINSGSAREMIVRSILGRNAGSCDGDTEKTLISQFQIPRNWILEAQALYYRSQTRFEDEIASLLRAAMWQEAHKTLITNVAPQAIISGDLHNLKVLLSKFTQQDSISEWENGGQIYVDAVQIIQLSSNREQTRVPIDCIALRLAQSLKHMKISTFEQRVAQQEISAVVIELLLQHQCDTQAVTLCTTTGSHAATALHARALSHFVT